MGKENKSKTDAARLRRLAEKKLKEKAAGSDPADQSADASRLLHELQVHRIELEMQNEELRRIQNELEVSWERYFDLYEMAPVGYLILNEKGDILEANLTASKMLGAVRSTIIKMPLIRFLHPQDRGIFDQKRLQLIETGQSQSCEMRVKFGDVDSTWIRLDGNAITGLKGEPLFRVVLSDITEQKQSEQDLIKERMFLVKAQEIGSIGTWELDIQKNDLLWTDENYRIFGLPIGTKLTYETFLNCVHPDDREYVDKQWKAAFDRKPYDIEHRLLVDGRVKWVREKAELEFNENGECIRGVGVTQDITDRKKADEEKEKLQSQLIQSQKMESIGRLAGGVAHDFNNLLTAIQGFSDFVQESLSPDDPMKKDVAEIQKAADSAAALTNQLLAYSRKQIISPKVLDLNQVISHSERMLRRIIGEDIDFVFSPDESIEKILVDPGQIGQILINLGVNSRDAMPDGGKFTIETKSVSLDEKKCQACGNPIIGDFVMLAVSDNGVGMDVKTMQNIFEPFFTTKEMGKGTGLGLSTVHGIVLQNNGHINSYSEPGEGTTFKIYLPVVHDQAESIQKREEPVSTKGSETILLVEDQDIVRKLAVRVLQTQGYTVLEAPNGGAAFLKFEKHRKDIDLLLTDVIMPQMSGKELHETLLKINPNLKVLFMSGYTEDAIAHHGILEKGIDFIPKPFRPKELARKVRQVLDS